MNAAWNSPTDFIQDNNNGGSDSDTNSDDAPEHYQPISGDNDEQFSDHHPNSSDNDDLNNHHFLPNGHANCTENGISSLDLSDDEEEEEEERVRESSESAIARAFREDESRRSAPLRAEDARRVMEAMRRVSFVGLVPEWASRVPEDRWIDQVRSVRGDPGSSAVDSSSAN